MQGKKQKRTIFSLFFILLPVVLLFVLVSFFHEQKKTQSNAIAATNLSFVQTGVTPITVDVMLDPGNNAVSYMQLVIDYDGSKLSPVQNGINPNTSVFPTPFLENPTNMCNGTQCVLSVTIAVGSDPTKAIKTKTTAATLQFTPVGTGSTQITFDPKTEVLSIGSQDSAQENVLASASPLTISLNGSSGSPVPSEPQPSTTIAPTDIGLNVSLGLTGIGVDGGNLHPLHPLRTITTSLYNIDTGKVFTKQDSVIFDGTYYIKPSIDVGNIPAGNYQIFVTTPQYLTLRLGQQNVQNNSSTFALQSGSTVIIPPNTLIAGDIAPQNNNGTYGDNTLDILDYNQLLSCYGNKAKTSSCKNPQAPDFDDNGVIDSVDYNILLRGFSQTHIGDTIPGSNN